MTTEDFAVSFQFKNAKPHRPVLWSGDGTPVICCLEAVSPTGGAERRTAHHRWFRRAIRCCDTLGRERRAQPSLLANNAGTHAPSGAPHAAILGFGTVLPGAVTCGFHRVWRHRVQPLKAAPRSRRGRLPLASRRHACEAHPQAPHRPLLNISNDPFRLLRLQDAS